MRAFIISTNLALALTQVGPAWGADDNITALVRGCHVYLGDLEDPNAWFEEGECIGVVKGLTAAALAQGVDLAKGIYRKSDPNPRHPPPSRRSLIEATNFQTPSA
jgi:hypothetical protein